MGGPKNDLVERLVGERSRRSLDPKLIDHVDDGFIDAPIHLGSWRRHCLRSTSVMAIQLVGGNCTIELATPIPRGGCEDKQQP